jgi:hypothetical protein
MKDSETKIIQGCCDFVGQLIYNACTLPTKPTKTKFMWKLTEWEHKINRLKKINIRWAKQSKLLTHYCDVMNLDRQKIENAIIKHNS